MTGDIRTPEGAGAMVDKLLETMGDPKVDPKVDPKARKKS
jgi:hypothetical protein